jgi:hypothetical protein
MRPYATSVHSLTYRRLSLELLRSRERVKEGEGQAGVGTGARVLQGNRRVRERLA